MNRFFLLLLCGACLLGIAIPVSAAPLLINHTTTDATKIPDQWITAIKADTKGIDYAYTSHGLYVIGGLAGWQTYDAKYAYATAGGGSSPSGTVLKIGNRNNYDWWDDYVSQTPSVLGTGRFRYSMFEWCTEMSTWSTAQVDAYLAQMEAFEAAYPSVTFIYTTGHADAGAADGGTKCRANNARIRAYAIAHSKVLYDYEDIGSHSPSGTDYLNSGCGIGVWPASAPYADECTYNGGNWCNSWLAANPSNLFARVAGNCQECCYHSPGGLQGALKGGAFWWMMARLEGWDGSSSQSPTGSISVTSTPSGAAILLDGGGTAKLTPSTLTGVAVGYHSVSVSLDGYSTPSPAVVAVTDGGTATAAFTLVRQTGSVSVTSTPSGAWVWLDGVNTTNITPSTLTGIPTGDHGVYVTLSGYSTPVAETKTVTSGSVTAFDFPLSVAVPSGTISVTSTPSGAGIFLDGVDSSQFTPSSLTSVPVGLHNVSVSCGGYAAPPPAEVTVTDGQTVTATFTLVQEIGSINVTSTPSGAQVWLDGADTTQMTPLTLTGIPGGAHSVSVTLSGYTTPATQTKTVTGNTVTSFDFPLTLAPAPFIMVTSPNGGESWTAGTIRRITWTSSGITGNVNIDLVKGSSVIQNLLSDTENDGSYSSWTISTGLVAAGDYRVRVTGVNNATLTDTSNATFTIASASPGMKDELGVFVLGTWYLDTTGDGVFSTGDARTSFGLAGDIPVSGDWNLDGTTEIGVFRPSTHMFYLDYNGGGVWNGATVDKAYNFGLTGDVPVSGDWNLDGRTEIGVFRPSTHMFYLDYNGGGAWNGATVDKAYNFGLASDIPLSGDWNQDQRTEIGVYRPSTHMFYPDYNGDGNWSGLTVDRGYNFGVSAGSAVSGMWG